MLRLQITTIEDFEIRISKLKDGAFNAEVNINGRYFGCSGRTKEKALANLKSFVNQEHEGTAELVN